MGCGYSGGPVSSPKSFSITREESEQLEREYAINDILVALYKALGMVGGGITIGESIDILSKKTRFADEIKNKQDKNYWDVFRN